MKLLQLSPADLRERLRNTGIWLRTGPFSLHVQSRVESVAKGLTDLYGQFEVRDAREAFADFHVAVNPPVCGVGCGLRSNSRLMAWNHSSPCRWTRPIPCWSGASTGASRHTRTTT